MIRYLTSLLLSVTANKLKRDLFRKRNSTDVIAATGVRQKHAIRSNFSKAGDSMILSLKAELGKKWGAITAHLNETIETEWSADQVRHRFNQLEKEEKEGGRRYRRVDWTSNEDARVLVLRVEYIKKNRTTKGVWKYIDANMPGKNEDDLKSRWKNHLSKSSAVTMTATTSTTTTLLAATSLDAASSLNNQPNLFGVSSTAMTKVAATKVSMMKVTMTKVAASAISMVMTLLFETLLTETSLDVTAAAKMATPTKVAPLSYEPSEYELRREQRITQNNARLAILGLGLGSEPKEAKKVVKKRKSTIVDEPQRVLPNRKRNSITYNEDYIEDVY
jgi:hypothetical protein